MRGGVALFAVTAFVLLLHRIQQDKYYRLTGPAEWVWLDHQLSSQNPVAFFLLRDFELAPGPIYVKIKVAADPEYTLYVNGTRVGAAAMEKDVRLDQYDITPLVSPGRNRIVIAARSANGVGGVLAGLDLGPMRENELVTDDSWTVHTRWAPELLTSDEPARSGKPPLVIGTPPVGRWNYPPLRIVENQTQGPVQEAQGTTAVAARVREIRVISGVAVASAPAYPAVAWDFGEVTGYGRIRLEGESVDEPRVIRLRYVNALSELEHEGEVRSLVAAPGEIELVDPQLQTFRYLVVIDDPARASVIEGKVDVLD